MSKRKKAALADVEDRVSRMACILDDLKADDIVALDLRGITDFTDFFLIATVRSTAQMRGASNQLLELLKKEGLSPFYPMEDESPNWTVLDYGNVVVHLFEARTREHYLLEELWGDAGEFPWREEATA